MEILPFFGSASWSPTTLRPRLLNGQTGDPALLLTLRWQGRALLIDLGRIDRTPGSVLFPLEAVFVSAAVFSGRKRRLHFLPVDRAQAVVVVHADLVGIGGLVASGMASPVWPFPPGRRAFRPLQAGNAEVSGEMAGGHRAAT